MEIYTNFFLLNRFWKIKKDFNLISKNIKIGNPITNFIAIKKWIKYEIKVVIMKNVRIRINDKKRNGNITLKLEKDWFYW